MSHPKEHVDLIDRDLYKSGKGTEMLDLFVETMHTVNQHAIYVLSKCLLARILKNFQTIVDTFKPRDAFGRILIAETTQMIFIMKNNYKSAHN